MKIFFMYIDNRYHRARSLHTPESQQLLPVPCRFEAPAGSTWPRADAATAAHICSARSVHKSFKCSICNIALVVRARALQVELLRMTRLLRKQVAAMAMRGVERADAIEQVELVGLAASQHSAVSESMRSLAIELFVQFIQLLGEKRRVR